PTSQSFLPTPATNQDLHSFPPRRSSDLGWVVIRAPPWRAPRKPRTGPSYGVFPVVALHEPLESRKSTRTVRSRTAPVKKRRACRSEEHTSELQSRFDLVCRLLLEKKKHR